MATKKKRRLTKKEIQWIREAYENAPQGRKPTLRQFAKVFHVNQPSIVKSLGGWKGIERGRETPPPTPVFERKPDFRNIPTPQISKGTFEDGRIKEIE